jgi:hypothetical protein
MSDLDFSSAKIVEEIQQGLRHLDEEEDNLVMLRGQLSKVKRFREEQDRKDDLIQTLRDRVANLEYENEFSQRQSNELEHIMKERIMVLEKSLQEKDELESQFLEFQEQTHLIEQVRDGLQIDLEVERNRFVVV